MLETRRFMNGSTRPAVAFGGGLWARAIGSISLMVLGSRGSQASVVVGVPEAGIPAKLPIASVSVETLQVAAQSSFDCRLQCMD